MSEDEGWRMEWRVRAPPSLPVWVVLPSRRTELSRTHYLGTDAWQKLLSKDVVDTAPSAVFTEHRLAVPSGHHPFVQPMTSMTEGCFQSLSLTGGEAVERDGETVHSCT